MNAMMISRMATMGSWVHAHIWLQDHDMIGADDPLGQATLSVAIHGSYHGWLQLAEVAHGELLLDVTVEAIMSSSSDSSTHTTEKP